MKFSFQFSNLYGTVYRTGDLIFTPDGNTVISPVGNKISLFDLKNHKSETLPIGRLNEDSKSWDRIRECTCIEMAFITILAEYNILINQEYRALQKSFFGKKIY